MLTTAFVKQYEQLKKQHADALLLVRDGQEYIALYEAAVSISKIDRNRYQLSYTYTDDGLIDISHRIPVRYINYKNLDACLKQCIDAGHRVAVSEQLQP